MADKYGRDEFDQPNRVLHQELVGFKLIAERMLVIAGNLDQLAKYHRFEGAEEDDSILKVLDSSRDWLLKRADVFRPPAIPQDGYPSGRRKADVVNLDSYRALKD